MNYYITHNGYFHADEIMGWVIVNLAQKAQAFIRIDNGDSIPYPNSIIADIGRNYDPEKKQFDHHQAFLLRDDGYPYATAGLLWKEYGHIVIDNIINVSPDIIQNIKEDIDNQLIKGLDAFDADDKYKIQATCSNGDVNILDLPSIISAFNCEDGKHLNQNAQFEKAAKLMEFVLIQKIKASYKKIKDYKRLRQVITIENNIAIIKEDLRWRKYIRENHPNVIFAILPCTRNEGQWRLYGTTKNPNTRELNCKIERPHWFKGFIHQGKWLAAGSSISEMKQLANYSLKQNHWLKRIIKLISNLY